MLVCQPLLVVVYSFSELYSKTQGFCFCDWSGELQCTEEMAVTLPRGAPVNGTVSDNLAGVKPLKCRSNWYVLATSPEYALETKIKGAITLLWHSSYSSEVMISQFSAAQPQVIFLRCLLVRRCLAKLGKMFYVSERYYHSMLVQKNIYFPDDQWNLWNISVAFLVWRYGLDYNGTSSCYVVSDSLWPHGM